mgnify:CR=1 FL=1
MSEFDRDLQDLTNAKNDIMGKLSAYAREFFPIIVLFFSIAVTVLTRLYTVGVKNPFDTEFWVSLGTNVATTMLPYIVYVQHGSDMFKATNQAYRENLITWGKKSEQIRKDPSAFIEYCRNYSSEVAENARRMAFESRCLIPWADFLALYNGKSKKHIRTLYKQGKLSKDEAKAVARANKPRRKPRIEPVSILCGSDTARIENLPRGKRNYTLGKIVFRPFGMLLFSAGVSIISPKFLGVQSADVIFSLFVSAFTILFAGITGNSAGNSSARQEASAVKSRIYFIDNFLSTQKETPTA